MGLKDHYLSAVKAALYNLAPDTLIVDISHDVKPFDVHNAAFLLGSVWNQFPLGTVHMIGINPEMTPLQPHLVVHFFSHYFIGADNGIFGLLFDETPEDIFEINLPQGDDWNFPMKGVFATCAAHLSRGGAPEFLGKRTSGYTSALAVTPIVDENLIKAHVRYIDHYGNVFTNLKKDLFESIRRGRNYRIIPKRASDQITQISALFSDGPSGEVLAMWASNGYLMLALRGGVEGHGGGAARLFGFHIDDIVRIEFDGQENS
jgi:S-adenosyl-L-methionine hydrolase (adenosine-forming)